MESRLEGGESSLNELCGGAEEGVLCLFKPQWRVSVWHWRDRLWEVRGGVVIEAGMGVYIEHSKYISFTRS